MGQTPSKSTRKRPQPARGGARPGAGRPARDTIQVTVRLHPATLALLSTGNRSREIEHAVLAFFRHHLEALRASPDFLDEDLAPMRGSGQAGRTKPPSKKRRGASTAGRTYLKRLTQKLQAAERAFAADAPRS